MAWYDGGLASASQGQAQALAGLSALKPVDYFSGLGNVLTGYQANLDAQKMRDAQLANQQFQQGMAEKQYGLSELASARADLEMSEKQRHQKEIERLTGEHYKTDAEYKNALLKLEKQKLDKKEPKGETVLDIYKKAVAGDKTSLGILNLMGKGEKQDEWIPSKQAIIDPKTGMKTGERTVLVGKYSGTIKDPSMEATQAGVSAIVKALAGEDAKPQAAAPKPLMREGLSSYGANLTPPQVTLSPYTIQNVEPPKFKIGQ